MMTQPTITMEPPDFLKLPYARRLVPDETGGFIGTIQEFPGCIAEGETAAEALANLEETAISWIGAVLEQGRPVPEPLALQEYSGKIALRLPRGIHQRAAELAQSESTSLNQLLVAAIANYLGGVQAFERLTHQFWTGRAIVAIPVRLPAGPYELEQSRTIAPLWNSNTSGRLPSLIGALRAPLSVSTASAESEHG